MPVADLLVLYDYAVVGFQLVNQLIGHVLFSVRELLILPLDKLDRLAPVVRSLDSPEYLLLQSLEPIAFFDRHVELLTFTCCYAGFDTKIKTYFLSVSLLFLEILLIDEACYLQVVSVWLPDQIRIGQFVGDLELTSCSDKNVAVNPLDFNLISRLEPISLSILF